MKFDQETIVKNRFWILVCLAAVLTLSGWVMLLLTAPASANKEKLAIQAVWNANKKHSEFVHPKAIDQVRQDAASLSAVRDKMQDRLYLTQINSADLMKWPGKMEKDFGCRSGKYATELLVYSSKAKPSFPPDDPATKLSGTLTEVDQHWFTITAADNQVIRFVNGPKTKVKDGSKELTYGDLNVNYRGAPVTVTFVVGKFFGEELSLAEKRMYRDEYPGQLHDVLAELGPVNSLNIPVVLFHFPIDEKAAATLGVLDVKKKDKDKDKEIEVDSDTWIFRAGRKDNIPPHENRFIAYVQKWRDIPEEITSDEIWTAQETVWIQREMFKRIKGANDALAIGKKIGSNEKSPTFENYYWRVELNPTTTGIEAKLTNLRPVRQPLDSVRFMVRFKVGDGKDVSIMVPPPGQNFDGAPVGPAGGNNDAFPAKGFAAFTIPEIKKLQTPVIEGVEQLQNLRTSAVKRLDLLAIGTSPQDDSVLSHRYAHRQLARYKKKDVAAPPPPPDASKDDPGGTPPPAATPAVEKPRPTRHGLILERYLDKEGEFRKIPVSLVLVVSPELVNHVLAELTGSPLRFFPTQVLWQRCTIYLKGGLPRELASQSSLVGTIGDSVVECVELTVYGLVTIYERPGRPQ